MLCLKKKAIVAGVAFIITLPWAQSVIAGYLSHPLENFIVNSWMDHKTPHERDDQDIAIMVRYDGQIFPDSESSINDCQLGINCYNGHSGTDLRASDNTPVYAAGDGVITNGYSSNGGYWLRIWHFSQGYSSYYGHLSQYVKSDGSINKGELIAYSGHSGTKLAHLHFGVYDSQIGWRPIDPFGWSGTTTDPWPYNQGYLWDDEAPPSWGEEHVSGHIAQDTTWVSGNVYVIDSSVTVDAGVTLTIQPNVVVKFNTNTSMYVYGTVNAIGGGSGGSFNRIYFTSLKDDAVGGDTNGDGVGSVPMPGSWRMVLYSGSSATVSHAVVRYGGRRCYRCYGAIHLSGGLATIRNATLTENVYGIYQTSGFADIQQSAIYGNTSYGVYNSGGTVLMAPFNWWGDASGPYHPSKNPDGKGDRVSDNVHFTPWRGAP
jgi:hypothetical protein